MASIQPVLHGDGTQQRRRSKNKRLRQAVHRHKPISKQGIQERLFTLAFSGLVYPQIWEDPLVDLEALSLKEGERLVAIASGGCNILSYLTTAPIRITAIDLNSAHVALNKLKLAAILPKESTVNVIDSDVEIRAKIRPAREVGGDFYDFFKLDADRLAIVIGDVCGKGIPASIFMAVVVTVLRTAAREEPDAASTIARANAILCRGNVASLFATTFYAVLNLRNGTLEYCNCGHNAPVHIPASGGPRRLAPTGLPLALFTDRPAAASCIQLNPGDDLILFTDGVTEALNPSKEEFGDRLLVETLLGSRDSPAAELVSRLFAAVDSFAQGEAQADDIACVAIRRRDLVATANPKPPS